MLGSALVPLGAALGARPHLYGEVAVAAEPWRAGWRRAGSRMRATCVTQSAEGRATCAPCQHPNTS